MMAADSDGYSITTVVTCEGDLTDPTFPGKLECVIGSLQNLLGGKWHIRKLEPWNSVRVTLSIPREAALRLRHLASEGSQQLRALGILSVQVEGDQVISLRLLGPEPQEIILRTTQEDETTSTAVSEPSLSHIMGETIGSNASAASNEKIQFRSPNVVCPTDTVVPKVPSQTMPLSSILPSTRTFSGPFPFTSMNQAIHSRDNLPLSATSYSTPPPPPYPGKHPPITISSPLLVNLLQNDGGNPKAGKLDVENSALPNCSGSAVQTNATVGSSHTYKYSTAGFSTQDTSFTKGGPVSTSATLMKKTVPNSTIKTNCALSPASLTSVNATVASTMSNFTTLLTSSSQSGTLQLSSGTQCNSTVSISNSSEPSNLTINNLNSLHSSVAVPCTSNNTVCANLPAKQMNTILYSSMPKPISSVPKCPQGFNVMNSATQCSFSNLLPNSSTMISTNNSNTPQHLSNAPASKNTMVRTVAAFRPYLPAYSSHQFESIAQPIPQLLELTPSLTDLKVMDLDQLLPTLEHDLARSPPNIAGELANSDGQCSYLINPLTGELEPHINSDSDTEQPSDIFTGLPSPAATTDEDTNSMSRPDTTDQSDSESRSTHSDSSKNSKLKSTKMLRENDRESPSLKPTEKIKLRLKLEKSEPVSPAYKVDVSFINLSAKKSSSAIVGSEELRVPPLHISLRGRNHAVINNRKKIKINSDNSASSSPSSSSSSPTLKIRKMQESVKLKKNSSVFKESLLTNEQSVLIDGGVSALMVADQDKESPSEQKKAKKVKANHEHREQSLLAGGHLMDKAYNSHFKERRGSDSDLTHTVKRYAESNGISRTDKKRRLSHTDQIDAKSHLFVLGSTNTGTVATLPSQKPRKEKVKCKDSSKSKELNRNKSYVKNMAEKLIKQAAFPVAELENEIKFKQRVSEESEKGVSRLPHRTDGVQDMDNSCRYQQCNKEHELAKTLTNAPLIKAKPPELSKANMNDCKSDISEKQSSRSPNSGAQGEDSGIESMDALSEKSPNQASQSPHIDISDTMKSKPQESRILDIEEQLAKMEGLNGEDLNENKHNCNTDIEQCCGLTSALQDSLKQGTVTLTAHSTPTIKEHLPQLEVSLVPLKASPCGDALEPEPVRISPPRYTYSNPDKSRGTESPNLSDSDSNPCSLLLKNKSLLEQLLIEIPDNQNPSSTSPVTRSLRTRASSKLSSPELNSPIPSKQNRTAIPKRKRHESDSSNNSLDDARNKKSRKCSENAAELIKVCIGVESSKTGVRKPKLADDSSDSDEPLIEVAGKVRKNNINTARGKFKSGTFVGHVKPGPVKTRSSVRTMPALNTRSKGDKVQSNANILRRKTRSSVSEGESKRRKDMK